uniref:Ribosomal protein L16 n=1 Tax=Bryopsis plumosa TaxID=3130 RepID=A0A6B9P4Z6_BRYPL|nr:ribosomal protein L16 [Bryopsis plumosa]
MATIPKKLAFKLYFREKTKTRKLIYRQQKLRQLSNFCKSKSKGRTNPVLLQSFRSELTLQALEKNKVINAYLAKSVNLDSSATTNKDGHQAISRPLSFRSPFLLSLAPCSLAFAIAKVCDSKSAKPKTKEKLNGTFYPKQKSGVWLINTNHVYFKAQPQYPSVSSKNLLFGLYGICTVEYATISAAYIETLKLDIAKILKKKGRVWTRVCCDSPVSARPAETRMGKGKGAISHWVAKVRPGQLIFEFSGITKTQVNDIFQKLCKKTSIGLSIIS